MPIRVNDCKTALQNIMIDLFEGEQIFTHLINEFVTLVCRKESDIDRVASEYVIGIGTGSYQTVIVRQVICISKYRAVRIIAEYILKYHSCECAGICNNDLIFMRRPFSILAYPR